MNKPAPIKKRASLLERAADAFDFNALLRRDPAAPAAPADPTHAVAAPATPQPRVERRGRRAGEVAPSRPVVNAPRQNVDREALAEAGMIVPGGPVSGLAEEFRIVKRRLMREIKALEDAAAATPGREGLARRVLIASANPHEGKTFCAINLAMSLAMEQDHEVLLVDADFAKPSILAALGLSASRGFMDALADPSMDVATAIIPTDIVGLSVLSAGTQTTKDSEYLASARTETVLARLTEQAPRRIVIFDSPPVLAASPALVLAAHVGQALMVVRADETKEGALKDAIGLMTACENIQLLLNGVKFSPGGRRFGTYYGQGE
ncbi:AAA family ATPase [Sphingorhabdus soli]|uniref:AAA family ATPase n=1 Tax=Flavisphingopyxis soli TaxID=2601267 RepID=A0A5C6U7Z2_9SPHN|nr:P-loop NTPase [Sphingorhabdus soli]TXC68909.1 AAA family ATPase [Sphingorhabdus soli]